MESFEFKGQRFCGWTRLTSPAGLRRHLKRLRRMPSDVAELEGMASEEAVVEFATGARQCAVWREYRELEPSLLLGREAFGAVDQTSSLAADPESDAPFAHAGGPAILKENEGGVIEYATLVEALESTVQRSGERGITYAADPPPSPRLTLPC